MESPAERQRAMLRIADAVELPYLYQELFAEHRLFDRRLDGGVRRGRRGVRLREDVGVPRSGAR